jgi:hypothetical protein
MFLTALPFHTILSDVTHSRLSERRLDPTILPSAFCGKVAKSPGALLCERISFAIFHDVQQELQGGARCPEGEMEK